MKKMTSLFKFSQADLTQLGIGAVSLWDRDQAVFAAYGKDQAWRDSFNAKVNTYMHTPKNTEVIGTVAVAY